MDSESLFDTLLETRLTFKNREYLRQSYTPEEFPHREEQIHQLAQVLVAEGEMPSNFKPGTDKNWRDLKMMLLLAPKETPYQTHGSLSGGAFSWVFQSRKENLFFYFSLFLIKLIKNKHFTYTSLQNKKNSVYKVHFPEEETQQFLYTECNFPSDNFRIQGTISGD